MDLVNSLVSTAPTPPLLLTFLLLHLLLHLLLLPLLPLLLSYHAQGFPLEFAMYLNYCRGLRFEEEPDYRYLRQLFRIHFRTLNHQHDYTFDWTLLKQNTAALASSSSTLLGGSLPSAGE